tara:strand:- start:101 stop:757 length:657 start_codon:yes stop_codon:yes gene_type:complete
MMGKKFRYKCLLIFVFAMCQFIFKNQVLAIENLKTGQDVFVACTDVHAHETMSKFSPISRTLDFGQKIKLIELLGKFYLPDSDYSSKQKLQEAHNRAVKQNLEAKEVSEADYSRHTWAKIQDESFVPTSCLVGEKLFLEQTVDLAEKKVANIITMKAKRNFSDDEKGDMRAMRGAAGKALGGSANFEMLDLIIEDSYNRLNNISLKEFRKSGHLGEFK